MVDLSIAMLNYQRVRLRQEDVIGDVSPWIFHGEASTVMCYRDAEYTTIEMMIKDALHSRSPKCHNPKNNHHAWCHSKQGDCSFLDGQKDHVQRNDIFHHMFIYRYITI